MININHFFYFDIPLSNIQKYLMKQEETLITKEKKKLHIVQKNKILNIVNFVIVKLRIQLNIVHVHNINKNSFHMIGSHY